MAKCCYIFNKLFLESSILSRSTGVRVDERCVYIQEAKAMFGAVLGPSKQVYATYIYYSKSTQSAEREVNAKTTQSLTFSARIAPYQQACFFSHPSQPRKQRSFPIDRTSRVEHLFF